ncbi:MAG: ASCH domain-containing protein, partial [Gammaproteobacteria bacterium]|nr:ASCH domain-containing protein [Gammaproteobacteria bacterium]
MPAYNFKQCFAYDVLTGLKSMTIRPHRKRATKPGDTLYLYAGMRSPSCQLLRKEECLRVT